MIPYTRHEIRPEDEAAVLRALRSGYLTQGPETEALEAELAAEVGTKYAVAVSSGTAALMAAYDAVLEGDDFIAIPAITFVATYNAAAQHEDAGTLIDIYDVDPLTGLGIPPDPDPDAEQNVLVMQSHGGAIPAVPEWQGPLILDAAHALGGNLRPWADAGATIGLSLHAAKQVCAGEGGAVCTNDLEVANQVRRLRNHGRLAKEAPTTWGLNLRMTEMSAALGRSQLARLHDSRRIRQWIWNAYANAFGPKYGDIAQMVPQKDGDAFHLAQVLTDKAPALREALGTPLHYPPLADLPGAREFARRAVTLPLYPAMDQQDGAINSVIRTVREVCG